jgi:hypothetical protein
MPAGDRSLDFISGHRTKPGKSHIVRRQWKSRPKGSRNSFTENTLRLSPIPRRLWRHPILITLLKPITSAQSMGVTTYGGYRSGRYLTFWTGGTPETTANGMAGRTSAGPASLESLKLPCSRAEDERPAWLLTAC